MLAIAAAGLMDCSLGVRRTVFFWRESVALLVACHIIGNFPVTQCGFVNSVHFALEYLDSRGVSKPSLLDGLLLAVAKSSILVHSLAVGMGRAAIFLEDWQAAIQNAKGRSGSI